MAKGEVKADYKKKMQALTKAAMPLIKHLATHYHPHSTAIVTQTGIEIVSGVHSIQNIFQHLKD